MGRINKEGIGLAVAAGIALSDVLIPRPVSADTINRPNCAEGPKTVLLYAGDAQPQITTGFDADPTHQVVIGPGFASVDSPISTTTGLKPDNIHVYSRGGYQTQIIDAQRPVIFTTAESSPVTVSYCLNNDEARQVIGKIENNYSHSRDTGAYVNTLRPTSDLVSFRNFK